MKNATLAELKSYLFFVKMSKQPNLLLSFTVHHSEAGYSLTYDNQQLVSSRNELRTFKTLDAVAIFVDRHFSTLFDVTLHLILAVRPGQSWPRSRPAKTDD